MVEPRVQPGRAYLAALRKLGMEPEALFWANQLPENRPVLVLITAFFDHAGPLEVEKALFKAYNAAATPAEIDPFIVRLHSPRQSFARQLLEDLRKDIEVETDLMQRTHISNIPGAFLTAGDLEILMAGVLKKPKVVRQTIEVARSWRKFTDNVNRLAA